MDMAFTPASIAPGADGDASAFFAKVTGFGYNDMISLPTLTKESILENLKRRYKVCAHVDWRVGAGGPACVVTYGEVGWVGLGWAGLGLAWQAKLGVWGWDRIEWVR